MSLTAIIVNYHTAKLLPSLIHSLRQCPQITRTIIIDNSYELNSVSLDDSSGEIDIIINEENIGFGAAINQGLGIAKTDWCLLINPDVRIEEGCLDALLAASEQYQTPLVGPRLYMDAQRQFRLPPASGYNLWWDFAGKAASTYALDAQLLSFYWMIRHERFWKAEKAFYEPFLSGACLLVNLKLWNEIMGEGKLFDERFFLYFEDTDLCARALRKGISPICVPSAAAVHYYNQAPDPNEETKPQLMENAKVQFLEKYYGDLLMQELKPKDSPSIVDLGILQNPPVFETASDRFEEERFLEIGVNPLLVPFVQADFTDDQFHFPRTAWSRIMPGTYFSRVRGSISGVEKVMMWKKN